MKGIRMTGKNVDDAIQAALGVLGVQRDGVDVTVIDEGGGGVLGFGGRPVEVEVSLKISEHTLAQQTLQEILDLMGYTTLVDLVEVLPESIKIEVRGEELGPIIGKDGATLDAIQFLTSIIVSRRSGRRIRIHLDAAGYRTRQQERLEYLARDAAHEAIREGREVQLPPMSPSDRRLVHIALKEIDTVTTYSRGEGHERCVIVVPAPRNA